MKWEFIQPTRPATTENEHTERVLALEPPDALDTFPRQAESVGVDGRTSPAGSRRVALILVGVGVVIGSAIITVRAIPRAAKIVEPPAAVAPGAPDPRLPLPPSPAPASIPPPAAETAPVAPAAEVPGPRASTTSSREREARTTQASSTDVRRSNGTSAASRRSAPPLDSAATSTAATSTDTSIEPAVPSAPEAKLAPAREPESGQSDTSVLPKTTATGSAGSMVNAATPPTATAPQRAPVESLTISAAPEPPKSAVAAVSRTPPRLLQGGTPEYPKALRSNRITGIVDVQVTIDETGRVTNATAVSGPGPLREIAARAVRSWRYQPATVNGVQTASTTTVSFHFSER